MPKENEANIIIKGRDVASNISPIEILLNTFTSDNSGYIFVGEMMIISKN